jgi:cytochrome oxidase Cu insertion factor (SCO1/SenC/PrrC family)
VDHSSTIILIDPDGRPRAIFTPPQTPERLAADFLKIRAVALP